MRSGLDIARLWMDGEAAIFNVQGREDNGHIAIMQVSFCIWPSPLPVLSCTSLLSVILRFCVAALVA